MTNNPVRHLEDISSFLAMEIFARAEELEKQGRDIIHLEFGEPDFPTPAAISQAAIKSIKESHTKYTHTQGIEEFRQAVMNKYMNTYGAKVSPSRILTSSGSSLLLYLAMRLLVPPGDEIIMTDICYPCYNNLAFLAGIKPTRVKIRPEDGFQINVDEVKKAINKKTKAILINSPMNPTGAVMSKDCMRALAELGPPIISDEIYGDLIYEGEPLSILNFTDNCIVINGLSKYYAMTGWRLGYMIINEDWVGTAARIHQNIMISANHFIQKAGAVALSAAEADCKNMALEFDKRRQFTLKRLKESGLDPKYTPAGAFYIFLKYPDRGKKSMDVSIDILEQTGVALTPGIDFGSSGEGFIRISYANSLACLNEAVNRLRKYFFKL